MSEVLVACSHGTDDARGRSAVATIVADVARLAPEIDVREAFVDVQSPSLVEVAAATTPAGTCPAAAAGSTTTAVSASSRPAIPATEAPRARSRVSSGRRRVAVSACAISSTTPATRTSSPTGPASRR